MDKKKNKKTIWIMLVIVVILAILVVILYIPKQMGFSSLGCDELLKENILIIDSANYCSNDNDCMITTDVIMHMCGSYELVNKNVNLEEIKGKGIKINKLYIEKNCPVRDCAGPDVPSINQVKCLNKKCVVSS